MPAWHSAAGSRALGGEVEVVLRVASLPLPQSFPPPACLVGLARGEGPMPHVWASPGSLVVVGAGGSEMGAGEAPDSGLSVPQSKCTGTWSSTRCGTCSSPSAG